MLLAKRWPRVASDSAFIVVADQVGPALLGIVRPRVVFPAWLMEMPARFRHVVLAHEQQHVAARDPVLLAAAQVLTIALPWNVPLWWFARRLRMAIEIDCDARVLRSGVDPAHYGEVLLAVGQHRGHVPANAAALIEPVTQLERRIRIMLTRPTVISKHRAAAALALTLVIAACATRLEAPSISTSPIPGDDLSSQLVLGNGRVEMSAQMMQVRQAVAPSTADTIVLADVVLRIADAIQSRPTTVRAAKLTASGDDILLEGDVRLIHEQTSIVTPRARIKTTPDGITLIEMDGAELIRTE